MWRLCDTYVTIAIFALCGVYVTTCYHCSDPMLPYATIISCYHMLSLWYVRRERGVYGVSCTCICLSLEKQVWMAYWSCMSLYSKHIPKEGSTHAFILTHLFVSDLRRNMWFVLPCDNMCSNSDTLNWMKSPHPHVHIEEAFAIPSESGTCTAGQNWNTTGRPLLYLPNEINNENSNSITRFPDWVNHPNLAIVALSSPRGIWITVRQRPADFLKTAQFGRCGFVEDISSDIACQL